MRCRPDLRQRGKYMLSSAALCLGLGLPAYAVMTDSGEDAHQAYNRGVAALRKGDARTARIELLNAVKAYPQWGSARLLQAQALLALGDGPGGEAEIGRARELGVAVPLTRHLMARALLLQGRFDDALDEALAEDVAPRYRGEAQRMAGKAFRSAEHTSELQSLMRISY